MKGGHIPDSDHIARYCGAARIMDSGNISGLAFKLRDGEEYLSVNWLEYLKKPNREDEIGELRKVFARKGRRVGAKARFAILNVGEMCGHVLSIGQRRINVRHEPEEDDSSHSGIYGLYEDDILLDLIAEKVEAKHYAARLD